MVDPRYESLELRATEEAGVDLISTTGWLCQRDACPLVVDHYLVYRDEEHLTATMAVVLAPQLRWAFDHLRVR
jgi:hypothetical protein